MAGKMRAVLFDEELKVVNNYPIPEPPAGWARIRVCYAGICKTDLELLKGYKSFRGLPGHEFTGVVDQCREPRWEGKLVVGEINVGCGHCKWCREGLQRHCPNRRAMGIIDLDGCMADYCQIPVPNLFEVPSGLSAEKAVMIEPLAAACEILEQIRLSGTERVIVLGDGPIGILCAWVMTTASNDVTLLGHHTEKLERAAWRRLKTNLGMNGIEAGADIIIEATGSGTGLKDALRLCRPRGTIVLKSTLAEEHSINLSAVVVSEINVIGSRCGRFEAAFSLVERYSDLPLERMITATYSIEEAHAAFRHADKKKSLKILLKP